MTRNLSLAAIVLLAALSGCTTTQAPSFGESVLDRSQESRALGEKWIQGQKMILRGEALKKKGQEMIESGEKNIRDGEKLIGRGNKMKQQRN